MKKRVIALSLILTLLISFQQNQKAEAIGIDVFAKVREAIVLIGITGGVVYTSLENAYVYGDDIIHYLAYGGINLQELAPQMVSEDGTEVSIPAWLITKMNERNLYLKSNPIITTTTTTVNGDYQKWNGTIDSPILTKDYPYQICVHNIYNYWYVLASKGKIWYQSNPTGGNSFKSSTGSFMMYLKNNSAISWTENGGMDEWNIGITVIESVQSNFPVYTDSNSTNIAYPQTTSNTSIKTTDLTHDVSGVKPISKADAKVGDKIILPTTYNSESVVGKTAISQTDATINHVTEDSSNIRSIFDTLLDLPFTIGNAISNFFTVDWTEVQLAMDFTDVWRTHFPAFYDITDTLKNISEEPKNGGGKFSMKIPHEMGGDDKEHVVLDYTVAQNEYIDWGRTIIKWIMWFALGVWIMKKFEPKIQIN